MQDPLQQFASLVQGFPTTKQVHAIPEAQRPVQQSESLEQPWPSGRQHVLWEQTWPLPVQARPVPQ